MKSLFLLSLLALPLGAHAEPQLDHAFGPTTDSTQALAFSPNGTKLAVAGGDGVKIYESATGRVIETRPACRWETSSVVWSPDGQSLAAGGLTNKGGPTGEIWLWKEGAAPLHWTTGSAEIASLAFSPDGRMLASAGAGGEDEPSHGAARLWDASSGVLQRTLGDYVASAASITFSPDGHTVLFSWGNERADKYQTTLCDAVTGKVVKTWQNLAIPISLNAKGLPIFKAPPLARTVKAGVEWRVDPIEGADHLNLRFVARKVGGSSGLSSQNLGEGVADATFGGPYLAAIVLRRNEAGSDAFVKIWTVAGSHPHAKLVQLLGERTASARELQLSGDGATLGIATRLGTTLLDAPPLRLRQLLPNNEVQHVFPDAPLSLSSDGKRLFDGRWLDLNQQSPRDVHPHLKLSSTIAFALSPDGRTLAGTFGDLTQAGLLGEKTRPVPFAVPGISVPNVTGTAPKTTMSPVRGIGFSPAMAWAPDNSKIAVIGSANSDRQLFLFDSSGKFEREIGNGGFAANPDDANSPPPALNDMTAPLHQSYSAVNFSPDGHQLLTAGFGNSDAGTYGTRLDLWDAETGAHIRSFALPADPDKAPGNAFGGGQISSLGISPDGKTWVAGGLLSDQGTFAPELLFLDSATGARIGFVPLPYRSSSTKAQWTFLDSDSIIVLNGNALEVWDWRRHRIQKSLYLIPQGQNLKIETVF